jgi:hypothetical protein
LDKIEESAESTSTGEDVVMGIMSMFQFRKKEEPKLELEPLPPKMEITPQSTGIENVRSKMDLMMTQLESLAVKYQTLTEKVDRMEKMVQEINILTKQIYFIAKQA